MRTTPRSASEPIELTLNRIPTVVVLLLIIALATGCTEDSASPIDRTGQVDALQGKLPTLSPAATLVERYAAGLAENDPLSRHQLLAQVYAEATKSDVEGMLGVIKEDLRKRKPEEVRVFANLFAKLDRRTALSEVLSWDYPAAQIIASEEVMSVWVQTGDSGEIMRTWSELEGSANIPLSRVHRGEIAMMGAVARHRDYDAINSLIADATDVDHRRRLIARLGLSMSQSDGESYLDYAVRVHKSETFEPEVKAELVLEAQKLALVATPEFAIGWYENIKDGPYSGDALSIIAEKWSRTDAIAALDFVRARPASEKPAMAKRAAAIIWLQKDPQVAEPYLREAVEADRSMDSVLLPLAQFMMVRDSKGAMELALRVPDTRERESVLKQGLMRWVQRDQTAAEDFMAKNPVSKSIETAVQGAKRMKRNRDAASRAAADAASGQ